MNKEVFNYLLLIAIMAALIIIYSIYVLLDEHKKLKYYDKNLYYETDWDKYSTMIVKQKKILFYKKLELLYYKTLVKLKRIFVWKH